MKDVFEKAQSFRYNSVTYKDLKDIGEVNQENIFDMKDAVFIANENNKEMQIHWGAESVEAFINEINKVMPFVERQRKDNKRVFIEFIPAEAVEDMEKLGFRIASEWVDFWVKNLQSVEVSPSKFEGIRFIKANEYEEASKVLCSCSGCSREFTGETIQWVKEWNETENSCILVAEINNELAGVCCLNMYGFDSKNGAVLWLREIGVAPGYQGQGIGHALIEKAFEWGKDKEARFSFLACDAENYNAMKLYEKLGYRRKEERGQINMAK